MQSKHQPRSDVLVVVPTYNEVENIARILGRVLSSSDADVLVVDDGSQDGTRSVVSSFVHDTERVVLYPRPGKMGLASAYREGFTWGLDHGYDVLGEMDADGSHPPELIPGLLAGLETADVVLGSRWVAGGDVVGWPWRRHLLSRGGNLYIRLVTGSRLGDATAGYRFYRREVLEKLDLETVTSEGYAFQIEMALRSWQAGFVIREVPITFVERQHGTSKMSRAIVTEALRQVGHWGLRIRRGQPMAPGL